MFNSGFLGVVIGLILIYFLLSLLVSGINEVLEALLKRRARYLEFGIFDLLGPLTTTFYKHWAIKALHSSTGRLRAQPRPDAEEVAGVSPASEARKGERPPSYIPASAFSRAVLDTILQLGQLSETRLESAIESGAEDDIVVRVADPSVFPSTPGFHVQIGREEFVVKKVDVAGHSWTVQRADSTGTTGHAQGVTISLVAAEAPDADALFQRLEATLNSAKGLPGSLREPLVAFLKTSNHDLNAWREQVEGWFDDKMDRLSGWYKRQTKWILFFVGLALVVTLNADTLLFSRTLWNDATLRSTVAAQARTISKTPPDCSENKSTQDNPVACSVFLFDSVKGLNIPLGWSTNAGDPRRPKDAGDWALRLFGLLLTSLALTLGAPFWFDLLNKVVNFRTTGPPPVSEAKAERSKETSSA